MSKIYSYFHVHAPFDPDHHFSTSWLVSPLHLAVFRLVIALYGVIGIIVKLLLTGQDKTAGASFSYFSNITYWGLTFYFLFAGLHSLSCSLRGRAWLELWPKWLQLLHGLLYSTIVTFPFLVTIVFWSVQFRPETLHGQLNAWSTISRHALNSVYALFEAVVPRTEMPPWIHLPCILLLLGGYTCIAYITHITEGFYPYGFLNAEKYPPAALADHLLGIGAGCGGVFILIRFFIKLRIWSVEQKLGKYGKLSKHEATITEDNPVDMEPLEQRDERAKD